MSKMNMIGCKCLNVIIETEANKFPIVERDQLVLTIEESDDTFFQNDNLRQVEKLDNINKSLPGLVETREVGSWIIHYCINCKVHTHAVHKNKGASCVLVSSSLLTTEAIKKMKNIENFSKVYGIVIDTSQLNDENEDPFYPSEIEPVVKGFRQTVTEAMRKETALVEERIKKFSEEQYIILDSLREKLFNEEQTLIRTMLNYVSSKSKQDETKKIDLQGLASPKLRGSPERKSSQPIVVNQSRHIPKRQKSTPVQSHVDAEFLFDFDGFEDNCLENEDYIGSDNEDSSNAKSSDRHSRNHTSNMKIAKSLPMDIPAFMKLKKDEEQELDDDDLQLEDTIDIAASIKKLAKSVHGSGIFGDLPRPRFSTQL